VKIKAFFFKDMYPKEVQAHLCTECIGIRRKASNFTCFSQNLHITVTLKRIMSNR